MKLYLDLGPGLPGHLLVDATEQSATDVILLLRPIGVVVAGH